jgi:hypothetical protein
MSNGRFILKDAMRRLTTDPVYAANLKRRAHPARWRAFEKGESKFVHENACSIDGTHERRVIDGKCAKCNNRKAAARRARKLA